MKKQNVELVVEDKGDDVFFTLLFSDTGEIRQKRRSKGWVMKRVFQSELKTWVRNYDEFLEVVKNENL